jgi:alpha-L-fucosidase
MNPDGNRPVRPMMPLRPVLALISATAASLLFAETTRAPYQPTFESLARANPAPEWFKDAKFGIYFHWGVYAVPAFANEWYPRTMYIEGSPENEHHRETYGAPEEWPYHNFILGARDKYGEFIQFAPKLKSAGGRFDPEEWAQLFAAAGARFAGPVAEHHDGYSMWASRANPWNAQNTGPQLDLVGLLTDAIRAHGMRTVLSMHHAYNITGFYEAVPPQKDPKLRMLYGQQGRAANEALWLAKHKEIIDAYHPDIIWQDFNLHLISPPVLLEFLSYYYNEAAARGQAVVATYKDGLNPDVAVLDYERGGPPGLLDNYWLTDDAISSSSWCYTEGIGYYTGKQVLHGFIDRVSKNGNLLLNVSPMADGTIPPAQRNLLLTIGNWLGKYGEAIYATRAWVRYGEGPTRMGAAHGVMGPPKEGTAADIRYTRAKDNSALYAILLGWDDGQDEITLGALSADRIELASLTSLVLLTGEGGATRSLEYTQDDSGLHVQLPARPAEELAYVIKLSFDPGLPPFDNFATLDPVPAYHLVPSEHDGTRVLAADLALSPDREAAASQWELQPEGAGVYALLNRAQPDRALTYEAARAGLALNRFTGRDDQYWKITYAPAGTYALTNLAHPKVQLDPADVDTSGSRWHLLPICELPQLPFKDHVLPGVIEAEDYDQGCAGEAYYDQDDINQGGLYRPGNGVDLGECSAGGYTLGWTVAGEWTAYTVNVTESGPYRVTFHVASGLDGAAFRLESDGTDLTGTVAVPNTRNFQNWTTIHREVNLTAGQQILKVVIEGSFVNLDKMVFTAAP